MENSTINIKNHTDHGICSNCGECCSDWLPLSSKDIRRIQEYLKSHKVERHNKPNCFIQYNFTCPFRNNKEKKCDIYEVRPGICRVFKCDVPLEQAALTRDMIEEKHPARSMTNIFFGDSINEDFLKKVCKDALNIRKEKIKNVGRNREKV